MFRFPWGDFHSLNLGWFLQKFNELREDWATAEAGIDGALDAEIQKAEDALTDVFAARDAAAASASAANSSALNASQSSLASMDARDQSRAARDAAQQAAGNAAASETAAGNSATAASNSAGAAATSATKAGNSATAAGNSATAAGQSATNAAASETAAGNSAAAAAESETAAGQSATDAEEAASSVEASAQQIATNASDIDNLKNALKNYPTPLLPYYKYSKGTAAPVTNNYGELIINGARSGVFNLTGENLQWFSSIPAIDPNICNIFIKANTTIKITSECLESANMSGSGWYAYLSLVKKEPIEGMSLRGYLNVTDTMGTKRTYTVNITEDNYYGLYLYMSSASGTAKYLITMSISSESTTLTLNNATKDNFYETVEETEQLTVTKTEQ